MPVELLRFDMLLPAFVLVAARVAGLVFAVPMLASSQIPMQIKVFLTIALGLLVFPAVAPTLPESLTLGEAAAGMVGELVIGEVLGLAAGVVFFGAQLAGKIVSHQSGLVLGEVFNPVYDAETTVLDQVWFFTALLFFLALRGHLAVTHALLGSFEHVPPMRMLTDGATAECMTSLLTRVNELALRLSGPAVLALLLSSLAMGVLTKTMPQFNILSVGFGMKVVIALFVMATTMLASEGVMSDAMFDGLDQVGALFERVAGRLTDAG